MSNKQTKKNDVFTSVVVKYKPHQDTAPRVVAKGKQQLAEKIVDIAKSSGVPIVEDGLLAQLLYQLEVGNEIPEELYTPVAKILVFIYRVYKHRFTSSAVEAE